MEKILYKGKSPYQKIEVFENSGLGKVLALDDIIQTTERDEFIYHEMMTHPALLSHQNPKNILIIGGGDGGVLRETLKHKNVKEITLVEIDQKIPEIAEEYLKDINKGSFKNKKTNLLIQDGNKFIQTTKNKFDVIIIDSSDPIGPAKKLFQKNFYRNIKPLLKKKGIMIRQTGSTFSQPKEVKQTYKTSRSIFKYTRISLTAIPTYVGGFFSLMYSSSDIDPVNIKETTIKRRFKTQKLKTKYYTPSVHTASFKLPQYVKKIIHSP